MSEKRIKLRSRSGYSQEVGGYSTWAEWQVWQGRKIIGRYELLSQAQRAHPDASREDT